MTVNILLISHDNIGQTLLDASINTLGFCPLTAEVLSIPNNCDPEKKIENARAKVLELNQGEGVLILTDIYGSTPSNIACALSNDADVRVISGLNLPMLIRVLNYPNLDIDELVYKAVTGGKEGIMECGFHLHD